MMAKDPNLPPGKTMWAFQYDGDVPMKNSKLRKSDIYDNPMHVEGDFQWLTDRGASVTKERVPIKNIRGTQDEIRRKPLPDHVASFHVFEDHKDAPVGVRRDGVVHLADGHHRANAAKANKEKYLDVHVVNYPGDTD